MKAAHVHVGVTHVNAAISACEKAARWETALELLGSLRRAARDGLAPDVVSFNSAISACEKAARWEEALETMEQMSTWCYLTDS